jgi:hypothetical protein
VAKYSEKGVFLPHLSATPMLTRQELQILYNCCDKTIRKWLRKAGITHRNGITPLEFETFKKFVGEPLKK